MRKVLNRTAAVLLMAVVMMSMSFAMDSENTYAVSKTSAAPKITKAAVVNSNAVQLKWSKARNTARYKVYRKKANGRFILVKTTTKRSLENKALAYGTRYTYKVTAISKSGKKNSSKTKVVYTRPAKPVIRVGLFDGNNVKVSWKKAKGAVKYKVYRKKAGGRFVLIKTTAKTTYEGGGLTYNTKYTYKVKSASKAGKMNGSAVKSVTTGSKPVVQPEPTVPANPDLPTAPEAPAMSDQPGVSSTPAGPNTSVTTERPEELSEPAVPEASSSPSEPAEPEAPTAPEQPAERMVTVKIPVYEDDTVYWIKSYEGEIIYKSTDGDAWGAILDRPAIIIAGVEYDPRVTYGTGSVSIIVGYDILTMTESEWKESYYNGLPDVTFSYND